jgi:hypothetical protein
MDGDAPYWFPALTLLTGAVLGYVADYLREGRAASRERAVAREQFERDALVGLQDALSRLGRATGAMYAHDLKIYKQTGQWGTGQVPDKWDQEATNAIGEIHRLRVRIPNAAVREGAASFISTCTAAGAPFDKAAAERAFLAIPAAAADIQEAIGDRKSTRLNSSHNR